MQRFREPRHVAGTNLRAGSFHVPTNTVNLIFRPIYIRCVRLEWMGCPFAVSAR